MPHLTFPIDPDGLRLLAWIGLDGATSVGLLAASLPIPAPICVQAEIDTACNVTSVAAAALQRLGVAPLGHARRQTAAGVASSRLFSVSLSIPGAGGASGPSLVVADLRVAELPQPIPGVDILIGLDILLDCLLIIDGPGRQFTLAF